MISQVESARAEAQSPWFLAIGVEQEVREEATHSQSRLVSAET